jgi:hypothetical protein
VQLAQSVPQIGAPAWTPVRLIPAGADKFLAVVNHRQPGAVDLKLEMKDAAGNSLRQQITRACEVVR